MRDPLSWSFPLGRLFGINVRMHWLFPFVAIGLILRAAFTKGAWPGTWVDVAMLEGLLFLSVLLHEFGHCYGARLVDGDANEVLLWPLGGLAYVEVPHTARANLITAVAGPAVNVLLCIGSALALGLLCDPATRPPLNPLDPSSILRAAENGAINISRWDGLADTQTTNLGIIVLVRLFWVNWFLFLLNVVLIGFPLDGGRIFQCILWPYFGYRQATLAAIFAGYVTMFVVGIFAIVMNELLPMCLAVFIYVSCNQQWILLETGGEESMFGYDFSQGYTSLERDQPAAPPRRRQSWWQRWQQRRAARKLQREQETRVAEERRMDELLQKVQDQGLPALTDEERRFLKRVSDRYRKH
jgi:stage IV sporulation protein FB